MGRAPFTRRDAAVAAVLVRTRADAASVALAAAIVAANLGYPLGGHPSIYTTPGQVQPAGRRLPECSPLAG